MSGRVSSLAGIFVFVVGGLRVGLPRCVGLPGYHWSGGRVPGRGALVRGLARIFV